MLKKTIAVLILLTMLLSAFAACGNIKPTSAPTDAPTEAPTEKIPEPTEGESEYGSDTCTEPPMPSEQMTEVLSEEPTEECTHEWEAVMAERCKTCGELHEYAEDGDFVRYHFEGIFTVERFEEEKVRECTDRVFLKLLNEKQWQKGDLTGYYLGGYEYIFNFEGNLRLYYSSYDGKFSNYLDCTYVELTEEERQTVNHMLIALFPSSLSKQKVDSIELVYCGYSDRAYRIEDEELEQLMGYICEMDARQLGDSTAGHYGGAYSFDFYSGEEKITGFLLWQEDSYSTRHYNEKGYAYFYHGDFSELYNYLSEKYPHEFWFPES